MAWTRGLRPRSPTPDPSPLGRGASVLAKPGLDRGPDAGGGGGAADGVDGDEAGGRSDVDLGQPAAADHVDADEHQAAGLELGPHGGADLLLARGERGGFGVAALGEVGAEFALARLAVDRAGEFAVDQDDAL